MSDRQLRQQHQDVVGRGRVDRLAAQAQAAADRARLADFYARQRDAQQAAAPTTT